MPLSPKPTTHALIKLFLLATQGQGKTGSIIPLSIAGPIRGIQTIGEGFNLRFLDFDGKAEEMAYAVLDKMLADKRISPSQHNEALERIDIVRCRENTSIVPITAGHKTTSKIGIAGSSATAWATAIKQLDKWGHTFSPSNILIIDSLTHAAQAAINCAQALNGKFNKDLTWQDFQGPQQLIAKLMTYAADTASHTIVNAHHTTHEIYRKTNQLDANGKPVEELVDVSVVPVSVGKAGSLELPSQFNHVLVAAIAGKGAALNRYIHTRPTQGIITKSPFFSAKDRYPIDTGMVEYFALRK